jgi:hypothetical protein
MVSRPHRLPFDGKSFTYINDHAGSASWSYDKPQFTILNLAFEGTGEDQKE